MTREELKAQKEELNKKQLKLYEEKKQIEKYEEELKKQERHLKICRNIEKLKTMREHKDALLSLITEHTTHGCNDENLSGAYIDHGVGRCTRCMLIRILRDDWEDEYELDLSDVVIREIR